MNKAATISCPESVELGEFLRGAAPEDRLEEIAEHLEQCPSCSAALKTVAVHDTRIDPETLPATARRAAAADAVWNEPECARMMAAAKALPEAPRNWPAGIGRRPLPKSLGQYELLEPIGAGGMGAVYKARHKRLDRIVALKIIAEHRVADPQTLDRFVREWVALAKLENEHIVRAIDADEDQGFHFLVMEYVEGIDLARLVRRGGRLSVADACEAIRQAALGLQYVAARGLVHRDIKPSNLMIAVDGQVKILDLGLALWQNDDSARSGLTSDQQILGTVDFMAPEQALDSHAVDIRGDIYSLGCTMYYLLCGEAPFGGEGYSATLKKLLAHSQAPRPAIVKRCPDVPPRLDALLQRMMAKSPSERPATAGKLARELEQFAAGSDLGRLARVDAVASNRGAIEIAKSSLPASWGRGRRLAAVIRELAIDSLRPGNRRAKIAFAVVAGAALLASGYWGAMAIRPGTTKSDAVPAKMGVSVDSSSAGEWQGLLVKQPHEVLFQKFGPEAWWTHYTETRQVRFRSPGDGVLELGTTAASDFEIEVELLENPWVGDFGLYIGRHAKSDKEPGDYQFQAIYIKQTSNSKPPGFELFRSLRASVEQRGLSSRGISNTLLPGNLEGTHKLKVTVRNGKLLGVWFDNFALPDVLDNIAGDAEPAYIGREHVVGGFGLYFCRSSGTVLNARFRKSKGE